MADGAQNPPVLITATTVQDKRAVDAPIRPDNETDANGHILA